MFIPTPKKKRKGNLCLTFDGILKSPNKTCAHTIQIILPVMQYTNNPSESLNISYHPFQLISCHSINANLIQQDNAQNPNFNGSHTQQQLEQQLGSDISSIESASQPNSRAYKQQTISPWNPRTDLANQNTNQNKIPARFTAID